MNKAVDHASIEEYKIQASILLKKLNSDNKTIVENAIKRFQCLPEFQKLSSKEIKEAVKRKHSLAVIALEKGFSYWGDLKSHCQQLISETFVQDYAGGFLNAWFANYKQAKAHQKKSGGFLLPYKKQFFICDADYINWLGLNAEDADWKAVDFDWVKPASQKAWQRLYAKWLKIQEARHESD